MKRPIFEFLMRLVSDVVSTRHHGAIVDEDVLRNAEAAYTDIRSSIDHQVRTASALDTRAIAVLTLIGAGGALVVPRVHLESADQRVAGFITFALVALTVVFALWSLRPRDFSYGIHPDDLLSDLEKYDRAGYAIGQVKGLREAYFNNDTSLDARHRWFLFSIVGFGTTILLLGLLAVMGAITNA